MGQEKQLEPAVLFGDEALHRRRLVDGVTADDEKDGLFGADQEPLEERDEDSRINHPFMDHEAEIARGLTAEIMLKEKRRPVALTTGISPFGAQVVPV